MTETSIFNMYWRKAKNTLDSSSNKYYDYSNTPLSEMLRSNDRASLISK
jgi:hypothetical protein